jgi:hypothetical protein
MTKTVSPDDRKISRRMLLAGVPSLAVALAACSSSSSGASTSAATATTASTATADGEAAAGSVAALAQAFYQTLDTDQKPKVLLDYTLASAKRWSNLPQGLISGGGGMPGGTMPSGGAEGGGAPSGGAMPSGGAEGGGGGAPSDGGAGGGSSQSRVGIALGDLTDAQLTAFHTLLKAATGTTKGIGYDEIEQQLNADDYLNQNGGGDTYGRGNFYVAILGSPQDTGTWEFQFGGHHLAVANTYIDGKLAGATPAFRGVEPFTAFKLDGVTNQPLKKKHAALVALLGSLSAGEKSTAKLADTYTDLVLGPGKDWAFPTTKEGLQISALSAQQKKLALAAIAGYVDDLAAGDAKTILAKYESELDDTSIAWSGTTTLLEQNDYVRIDGTSVWIEFSMQHGIVLSGNHPHSVWRDRTTDYGGTKS